MDTEQELFRQIKEAAIEVHRLLGGPGLMENIYESALSHELTLRGLSHHRQVPIEVTYKNAKVREPLYLDILVQHRVILELKALDKEFPFHQSQLLTYLRLTGLRTGMLINFGKKDLTTGIHLVTNTYTPTRQLGPQQR